MTTPKYPVYIISKGRWESRQTVRALEVSGVDFRVVIEPPEYDDYARVINPDRLLVLPFHDLGQGSIPARNWVWGHATEAGHERHWIIDDNISGFYRFNRNLKVRAAAGPCLRAMESFVDRYANVPIAGPNYHMFVKRKEAMSPFRLNTRIYSCILLSNNPRYASTRWRGKYNEDTDLSLRFLKARECSVLFNAFLIYKAVTMTMTGGNTDDLYRQDVTFDGRLEMAQSLRRQHPDVVTITRKWGRWQHSVDYRPFRCTRLQKRSGVVVPTGIDNFGMSLKTVESRDASRT